MHCGVFRCQRPRRTNGNISIRIPPLAPRVSSPAPANSAAAALELTCAGDASGSGTGDVGSGAGTVPAEATIVAGGSPELVVGFAVLTFSSGRHRPGTDNGMVLGQCKQRKGDPKQNDNDRGSDETDQEEIEHAADVRPFRRRTAAGRRSQLMLLGGEIQTAAAPYRSLKQRPFPLRTKNCRHNAKQPLDRKSPIQVRIHLPPAASRRPEPRKTPRGSDAKPRWRVVA
jgi:hypothetical protein